MATTTTTTSTITTTTTSSSSTTTYDDEEESCENKVQRVVEQVQQFYKSHTEIKQSHGIDHVMKVFQHTHEACQVHTMPVLSSVQIMCIKMAALLHDVDDAKYFPHHAHYENAKLILQQSHIFVDTNPKKKEEEEKDQIFQMIQLVSCSQNGNTVPDSILAKNAYHLLIPRWADRLEAVGARGVVRCYQYNVEHKLPLWSTASPRPWTVSQVWEYATPQRFKHYMTSGGQSEDMISHYYDKLLHIARPPPTIVQNSYLERQALESSKELVEMCLRFGKTGRVDETYIRDLEHQLQSSSSSV